MKVLISDTSVLLNLLAANCLDSVVRATGWQFKLCPAVRDEVKKLRDPTTGKVEAVDISSLLERRVLEVIDFTAGDEQARYIDLASTVDDGEAMSIAIAVERDLDLAIDDKQAGNHARRIFPTLRLWTTPEILKAWSEAAAVDSAELQAVILLIESRARYAPAKTHALYGWWQTFKSG
jgi:predicted nucleic acid-binding protein